jgi:YfiR/HmsC-like
MKKLTTLAAVFLIISGSAFAQTGERPIHEVYSMMVFNFTRYVQWPDQSGSGEFVIGVVGSQTIFATLTEWYGGKPKGSKTYVIKKFNSAADVTDCHVLFIDKSKSGEFEAINTKLKGKGTLLITDKNGLGEKGSGINFKTIDNKLKFELNQKAIETANLKVSSSLSSMAILI